MKNTTKEGSVICSIDVRDYDQQVIDLAASMAKAWGVGLDVVHVTLSPDPTQAAWPAYVGAPGELVQDQILFRAIDTTVAGVVVHRHHLSGMPADSIVDFANEHPPRLLVVGTHARRGIARILGSVATEVMRTATCPVMVVRQRQNDQSWTPFQVG